MFMSQKRTTIKHETTLSHIQSSKSFGFNEELVIMQKVKTLCIEQKTNHLRQLFNPSLPCSQQTHKFHVAVTSI